ncbi:MAG: hypothetical protein AB8B91_03785 [Rubripirellula sp.]
MMKLVKSVKLVCFLFAAMLTIAMADTAEAQRPGHYYPARPTFSTYLLYRQFNATGVPNYYQYVRPASQYRDFLSRSQPQNGGGSRRQQLSVEQQVASALENQLRQRTTTGIGQPSVPAQFNETSHFYPRTPNRRR